MKSRKPRRKLRCSFFFNTASLEASVKPRQKNPFSRQKAYTYLKRALVNSSRRHRTVKSHLLHRVRIYRNKAWPSKLDQNHAWDSRPRASYFIEFSENGRQNISVYFKTVHIWLNRNSCEQFRLVLTTFFISYRIWSLFVPFPNRLRFSQGNASWI